MAAPLRIALLFVFLSLAALAPQASGQTSLSINGADADRDEELLEKALLRRGSIDFQATPLHDALVALSQQFQAPLVLARRKLEEAGVPRDTPVTMKLDNLPLQAILRRILADLELSYTVVDGVILVSSPEDIESRLETRVYPVLDLVRVATITSSSSRSIPAADYDSLIELITATIKPDSWDDVGGPGAVDALENAGVLVISHTREFHQQVEGLLGALRLAKQRQGITSLPSPDIVSRRVFSRPAPAPAAATGVTVGALPSWQLPRVHAVEKGPD